MSRHAIAISPARRHMVDEAIDAYVDWREECTRVSDAYDYWLGAVRADTALSFWAYMAALDREQRASEIYAERIGRLETAVLNCLPTTLEEELTYGAE